MSTVTQKDGSGVLNRGLRVGLEQAAAVEGNHQVETRFSVAQEKMVLNLCNLLGFSARFLLNAALRYALHEAKQQRIQPNQLKEFPKRLTGRVVQFELTAETASQVEDARVSGWLPGCAVAGVKLLHERILKPRLAGE